MKNTSRKLPFNKMLLVFLWIYTVEFPRLRTYHRFDVTIMTCSSFIKKEATKFVVYNKLFKSSYNCVTLYLRWHFSDYYVQLKCDKRLSCLTMSLSSNFPMILDSQKQHSSDLKTTQLRKSFSFVRRDENKFLFSERKHLKYSFLSF